MTAVIIGGDELTRAGCRSLIGDECEAVTLDLSVSTSPLECQLSNRPPVWIVILGWSINLDEVVAVCRSFDRKCGMVLVLPAVSRGGDPSMTERGLDLGFDGILSAESDLSILTTIIRQPPNGIVYFSRDIINSVIARNQPKHDPRYKPPQPDPIMAENSELLECIVSGWSNKEIARYFDVSENRIKARVRHIMRTAGVTKRAQLAAVYLSTKSKDQTDFENLSPPISRNQTRAYSDREGSLAVDDSR